MIAAPPALEQLNFRLAHYYLDKLCAIESAYQYGHEHSDYALTLLDAEWTHIKQWQTWVATHTSSDTQIAKLCRDYAQVGSDVLPLRQHPQERLEWLDAGLAAAQQLGDAHAEMVNRYLLGRVYHTLGPLTQAQATTEMALALAQRLDNRLYISKILILLGNIFYTKSEYDEAQAAIEQALILCQELDAKNDLGAALNVLGNIAFGQSDYVRACDCLVEALSIYEIHGLPHQVCTVLDDLSNLTLQMGDEQSATMYAERCVALARAIGDKRQLSYSLGVLGNLAKTRGNFGEAKAYFQQSLDISRLLGRPGQEMLAWIRLGSLFLQIGDFSEAVACFESALTLPNTSGLRAYRAIALMAMAQSYRLMGELRQAALKLHEGVEIALNIKSVMIQAWYLLEAAWLWHDRGQFESAAQWMALLQANIGELDGEQQTTLDELKQKLKNKLGQAGYTSAIEPGKSLDLDSVMQSILSELSTML